MLRLIPLGGLGEIGLNAFVFECEGRRLLVDCGLMFPRGNAPGVEVIYPDLTYLLHEPERLDGVVLTHAHEDHLGALTALLRRIFVPVYATKFTLGLARYRVEEAQLKGDLREIAPRVPFRVGETFVVEALRVTHSVPDAIGLVVQAGGQTAVHTGDFKLDLTPTDGQLTDLNRLGELGEQGIDCLLSDSTNAEVPGSTPSEKRVQETFERLLTGLPGRAFVTMFGSHLHRVQHLLSLAERLGRKVLLAGRALDRNVRIARELGFITVRDDVLVDYETVPTLPPSQVLVICTGAQAEVRSALMQMVGTEPRDVRIEPGDTVIFSSRTIPGNEPMVSDLVDRLLARGAKVVTPKTEPLVHVSGHASRDEQQKMIETAKPKVFVPIHGELKHLHRHLEVAHAAGVPAQQRILLTDGDMLGIESGQATTLGRVPVGQLMGRRDTEGTVTLQSLDERRVLAEGGVVVVTVAMQQHSSKVLAGPTIDARGLWSDEPTMLSLVAENARAALNEVSPALLADDALVKELLTNGVRRTFKQLSGRKPPVIAVVLRW